MEDKEQITNRVFFLGIGLIIFSLIMPDPSAEDIDEECPIDEYYDEDDTYEDCLSDAEGAANLIKFTNGLGMVCCFWGLYIEIRKHNN